MSQSSSFPPAGFLLLGILSLLASLVFIARAIAVDATPGRIWSAVLFCGFGVSRLIAYRSTRRDSGSEA